MFTWLNIYDEGIIVYGATRVMQGQIPYRDFWTQYSPGQFYTLSALFSTFGKTIMVERWWDVACRAGLSIAIYLVASQLSSRITALFIWALSVMWLAFYGFFGYPIFQGMMFAFLSIYFVLRSLSMASDQIPRRDLIAAGVLLGLTAIFRHDMAIYLAASEVIVLVGFAWSQRSSENKPGFLKKPGLFSRVWLVLAIALVIVAPVAIFFLITTPPNELAQQLFIFPLITFPRVRDLPYPALTGDLSNIPFYIPFLSYALAALVAFTRIGHMHTLKLELEHGLREAKDFPETQLAQQRAQYWGAFVVILFGLFGFNQARVRSDQIHTPHFFLATIALLPFIFQGFRKADKVGSTLVSCLAIFIALVSMLAPLDWYSKMLKERANAALQISASPPIAAGALMSYDQRFLINHLQRTTKPGEMMYLGLSRHDRVFANDVMLYFVMQVNSPTRYHELHPGLVNTPPVQQEMLADLEKYKPNTVVLTDMFEGANEPNDSSKSSGVTILDDYIKSHYKLTLINGSYKIYRRK